MVGEVKEGDKISFSQVIPKEGHCAPPFPRNNAYFSQQVPAKNNFVFQFYSSTLDPPRQKEIFPLMKPIIAQKSETTTHFSPQ
ncbi:hypothetical protein SAMN02745220_02150 [Desulfopila aestuarii DSM 18488]|uniref:Uncharacterized protein n=1 Tax=Desulfopila aestuarii DSM 18488 TaxID=1121416 RepID=A0A1M7Y6J8_9BACT|nr:hypothetical protein SAMN02745220_02150 [Desulfopila aestuarii DSM 18488]